MKLRVVCCPLTTARIRRMQLGTLRARGIADDNDDAYVATSVDRPAPTSPDTRAALAYLAASGATAISIVEIAIGHVFGIGNKIDQDAAMVYWTSEPLAKPVAHRARKFAGEDPTSTRSWLCGRSIAIFR
jgi:hypothetical protein